MRATNERGVWSLQFRFRVRDSRFRGASQSGRPSVALEICIDFEERLGIAPVSANYFKKNYVG